MIKKILLALPMLALGACTTVNTPINPGAVEGYDPNTGTYASMSTYNGAPRYVDSNGYFKTMTNGGLYLQGRFQPDGEFYCIDQYGITHVGWATGGGVVWAK